MAESEGGEKTEAPTPRRRQEAAEEGQVAKSPDLVAAVSMTVGMIVLGWFGPKLSHAMQTVMSESFSAKNIGNLNPSDAGQTALNSLVLVGMAMAPLTVSLIFAAVMGNVLQVGLVFNPAKLQPNLGALNPLRGMSRLLGGWQVIAQMAMNIAKLTVVGFVAYTGVHSKLGLIVASQQMSHTQAFALGASLIYDVTLRVAVTLLILSLTDYIWRRIKFEQDLRMTKQEVKQEMKSMEGDPMVKQRRRQIAMKMARDRQKKAIPTADVVVTNPTEYAIALKYDPKTGNAPRVVAKGRGLIAVEIRRIAIEAGVPILERPPLARALYRLVEVGHEIPEEFFGAVAEILAYVYELTGKLRKGRAAA
jgi:flagellar biosynthetic protein FlhB